MSTLLGIQTFFRILPGRPMLSPQISLGMKLYIVAHHQSESMGVMGVRQNVTCNIVNNNQTVLSSKRYRHNDCKIG